MSARVSVFVAPGRVMCVAICTYDEALFVKKAVLCELDKFGGGIPWRVGIHVDARDKEFRLCQFDGACGHILPGELLLEEKLVCNVV